MGGLSEDLPRVESGERMSPAGKPAFRRRDQRSTQPMHSSIPKLTSSPSIPPRRRRGGFLGGLTVAALLGIGTTHAQVLTVSYADLTDPVPGTDRWLATYRLEGTPLESGQGFTVYLSHVDFRNLALTESPSSSDWGMLLLQPDLGLPDDGILDGLALTSPPRASDGPFRVAFDWLAVSTTPWEATQNFEFYDTDGGFQVIGSGTVTPVPEPAVWATCAGVGLLGVALWSRLSRRESRTS